MEKASLYILFILIIDSVPGFSFILDADQDVLKWPEEYNVRGETTNLLTGIIKPFEFWYSTKLNVSRLDYYGGTVKRYYFAENDEEYGLEMQIFTKTTEQMTNEIVCEENTWEDNALNLLKLDDNFTYYGETVYYNKEMQIWKSVENDEETKKVQTLYAYEIGDGIYEPAFHEKIKHNLWTGALDSHTIIRYYKFSPLNSDDLNLTTVEACEEVTKRETTQHQFNSLHDLSTDVDDSFLSFKIQHNKKYKADEHEMRKLIFQKNLRRVIEHNQKNLGYKLSINKFSDLTDDELAYLGATLPSKPHALGSVVFPHTEEEVEQMVQDLPESYDMRIFGFISSVKNQGTCGSCWAFATTAAVEGILTKNNGYRNVDLSEQSLVDCAWGYGNWGCKGGTMDGVFKYVVNNGIPTEEEYGLYLEENGVCAVGNMTDVYRIRGFGQVSALSVNAMKVALHKYGPVTVAINAAESVVQYASGIFYDPDCNKSRFNHAVTVVGYGVRDGVTYWIVKNSWGDDWGQDGYILFSTTNNNCHILENAYYPVL